jgi:uncharacterized protein (DUF433 family)
MSAFLPIPEFRLPLACEADGTVRVGGTRVTLDTLIGFYLQGESPEQLAENFSTLELADIHAVIAFYLRNRQQVDDYLAQRQVEAEELRRKIEADLNSSSLRERLLARRS